MKFKSRKLWISIGLILLLFMGPLVYKHQGISDQITLWVLSAISLIGSAYLGINVLQKKLLGAEDKGE